MLFMLPSSTLLNGWAVACMFDQETMISEASMLLVPASFRVPPPVPLLADEVTSPMTSLFR